MPAQNGDTSKVRIYKELRRSIIRNALKPGERLNLDDLASKYNTSVTPVREALQMLTQEGLVINKPHAGFYIAKVTLKQLRDLLELCEILEIASAERAATRISEEQLATLEKVAAGYSDDEASQEPYLDKNRYFHHLIAQASGNRELTKTLKRLHDRLTRFFVFAHAGEEIKKRHKCLIEALRTGDVDTARETIREEMNEIRQITLDLVIQEDSAAWYVGAQID